MRIPSADILPVKRGCLLLVTFALAAPAVALADGPPGPAQGNHTRAPRSSGPGQRVAAALCLAELKQLGAAAFKAKYPTRGDCLKAHADQAAQIAADCKTADDRGACVRAAVGVGPNPGRTDKPKGRKAPALMMRVAGNLCRAERKTLGTDAFKQKYASPSACLQEMKAKATTIVQAAETQCSTAQDKRSCVREAVATALGLPARPARTK